MDGSQRRANAGYNPVITDLQFTSRSDANYTVSNVWIGTAATIFAADADVAGRFSTTTATWMRLTMFVWRKNIWSSRSRSGCRRERKLSSRHRRF